MSARKHGRTPTESLLGVAATVQKRIGRLAATRRVRALSHRTASSNKPVTGDADVVVSLTTFGARLDSVHIAIESIAAGTVRPARLILWVDENAVANAPEPLLRLVDRGIELRGTRDVGPHTKYFPTLGELAPGQSLVTADDDIVYPRRWLERLTRSGLADPDTIHCYRSRRIVLTGNGFAPYRDWPLCYSRLPSHRHFLLGVSGVLHPPRMIDALRAAGDGFRAAAAHADDVWLNAVAAANDIRVRQLSRVPRHFSIIPGSQTVNLHATNLIQNGNDPQLVAAYSPDAMTAVRADRDR